MKRPVYRPGYGIPYPVWAQQQEQSLALRHDGTRIGVMIVALMILHRYLFSFVITVLTYGGVFDWAYISDDFLGLGNTVYLLFYGLIYAAIMGLPLLAGRLAGFRHDPWGDRGNIAPADAFFGLLMAVGLAMVANYISEYVQIFLYQFGVEPPAFSEMMVDTTESFLLNLLVIAALPALLEEGFFRGMVLRPLRRYGDRFAILMSAALFGLMHLNPVQIPFAFMLGLVIGWLYCVTDSIWLGVAVHFANNAFSVAMDYAGMRLADSQLNAFYVVVMSTVGVIGAIAFLVLRALKSPLLTLRAERPLLPVKARLSALFRSPAFTVSVLVMVFMTIWEQVVG